MMENLKKELKKLSSQKKAASSARFFKTGEGQYGYGDIFYGITVPKTRSICLKYDLSLEEIAALLKSKVHEERLSALMILVHKYKKTKDKKIADFYLANTNGINNWDLVDLSADKILGDYLLDKDKSSLYKLAKSSNLWERRIAMVSTLAFIRANKFEDTIKIAEILLYDKHDLIQKAAGWMLREMGKRDEKPLIAFLDKYHKTMPRTSLRYAIERLSEGKKKHYMSR